MVVVEPTVSLEKLSAILAEGAESEVVDFKREHDPGSRLDAVVLAKEAGAMQMLDLGGYVVLGVINDGSVSGLLTDAQATQLDESVVRAKLLRYLDEPLELLVAAHKVDDQNVVLIYVGPSRDCFAVFKADGSYAGPDGRSGSNSARAMSSHATARPASGGRSATSIACAGGSETRRRSVGVRNCEANWRILTQVATHRLWLPAQQPTSAGSLTSTRSSPPPSSSRDETTTSLYDCYSTAYPLEWMSSSRAGRTSS